MTHSLVFHIANTAKRIQKSIEYRTSFGKLSFTEASTLVVLLFKGEISQTEIAAHLYLESPSVVSLIDNLEELKLVKRLSQDGDRRKYIVVLTEKGKTAAEEVWVQIRQLNNVLRGEMSHDEYKLVHKILLKLDDRLSQLE